MRISWIAHMLLAQRKSLEQPNSNYGMVFNFYSVGDQPQIILLLLHICTK